LKVAKARTCWCVQAGGAKTGKRDHEGITHAAQERYRVGTAARTTSAGESP
jgi:hypothetical protein